jgi:hypothetical protein
MNIDKQLSGDIIMSATISATFSAVNDTWTYNSDSIVTDLLRWTYYNDTTAGELKTRYLKREYRISRDTVNWSDWIEIEDLGEISAFPDITPSNDFYFQLKWTREGTNTTGDIVLTSYEIKGDWDRPTLSNPLGSLGSIGSYFILTPIDTFKAFKITGFEYVATGETQDKYLQINYRISQDSGRTWTQWEELTNDNISTKRINPIRFFRIEYEIKRVGTDDTGNITLYDLNLTGDYQNVTQDYQKVNLLGIRACCEQSNTANIDGNPQNCEMPSNLLPMTEEQKSKLLNPYAINKALEFYSSIANSSVEVTGHEVVYILTDPDGRGIDYTFHEYQLYNYICEGSIKVIPEGNNFPDNQLKINQFDLSLFDTFEVHITKQSFKDTFGPDKRPGKEDIVYFCDLNKAFRVEHAQAIKTFNNASVYYKVILGKWNQDASIQSATEQIKDRIAELSNNSTIDELMGIENDNDKKSIANKPQQKTLSKDLIRHKIYASMTKGLLENASLVLSKSYYNMGSVPTGATAVTYLNADNLVYKSDNRSYMSWFNINSYTSSATYSFIDNFDSSNNIGYKINMKNNVFNVNWNGTTHSMTLSTTQSQIKSNVWYCYLCNVDQRQKTISQYLYKRNVDNEADAAKMVSTILLLLKDVSSSVVPAEFELEGIETRLIGSPMSLTNIRLFSDVIPYMEHHKILNQAIIRDSQYLIFGDNANNRINLSNYPFNGE